VVACRWSRSHRCASHAGTPSRKIRPLRAATGTQQAAEKAIKAVLLKHSIRFPRTHDLRELIVLVRRNGIAWPFALDSVETLSPFAVQARYPDDTCPLDENDIEDAPAWIGQPCLNTAALKRSVATLRWLRLPSSISSNPTGSPSPKDVHADIAGDQ
jgi:hypothetical protein